MVVTVFDDIFEITAMNPDGKKFEKSKLFTVHKRILLLTNFPYDD
jgi:hypothetical protein